MLLFMMLNALKIKSLILSDLGGFEPINLLFF
jgi:hypothetical protein